MRVNHKLGQRLLLSLAGAALVFGAATLTASQAQANLHVGPLCGPSFQWSCSKLGGPDLFFVGTACDKKRFERRTGTTCTKI